MHSLQQKCNPNLWHLLIFIYRVYVMQRLCTQCTKQNNISIRLDVEYDISKQFFFLVIFFYCNVIPFF